MLSILFFILKLIGIILASILGILIVLLLIVLFVPIRYRIDGQKYETISLEAKIGWLLRILYCHILYVDNKLSIQFRIFGKLYYDNNNDNHRNKKVKKRKKKNKNRKPKAKNGNKKNAKRISKDNDHKTITTNDEESKLTNSDKHLNTNNSIDSDRYMDSDKCIEECRHIDSEVRMDLDTHVESDGRMNSYSRNDFEKANVTNAKKLDNKNGQEENHKSKNSNKKISKKINKKTNKKIKRFFRKLKQIFTKIKHFFIKLKEKIVSLKKFIKNIKSKITILWNKWEKIKAFFHNETNKAGIKKIWISIKKLVKHIYPTKLKMEVEYGTGDPCDTGQALAVMGALYGYYGKSIKIIPNFETEILEGTLHCKGRIRIFTLLIISIKLILDKNFRKLIQNFNSIKEEL